MDKREIEEMAITELIEDSLQIRRENAPDEEKELYRRLGELAEHRQEVLKKLSEEDRLILEEYHEKDNLIAEHDCRHLYVQGIKDGIEMLKRVGVL